MYAHIKSRIRARLYNQPRAKFDIIPKYLKTYSVTFLIPTRKMERYTTGNEKWMKIAP